MKRTSRMYPPIDTMIVLRGPTHAKLYTLLNAKMPISNETQIESIGIVASKLEKRDHQHKLKTSRPQFEILGRDPNHPLYQHA